MQARVSKLFSEFVNSEKSGGIILIACTLIALLIANSPAGDGWLHFWHTPVGVESDTIKLRHPLEFWVNDGLMAVFFLLVGLEIKRELYIGELSTLKSALFPFFAAVGGMLVPALIHFFFNHGTPTSAGFGIPMATDIAFALGILSLLGNKVPVALKIFLTAFAIIDDLGAILVIAIAYTKGFSLFYFAGALAVFSLLLLFSRFKINRLWIYILPGLIMWYCMLQSGVHATISGILLAFALPFGNGEKESCSSRLQHMLHKPVAFLILPLFALANTGIVFATNWSSQLGSKNSLGIMAGLVLGKPIGVMLFAYMALRMKLTMLASGITWKHVFGAAILGGIGFTMSIFITLLAFNDAGLVAASKTAVLLSSLVAGIAGLLYLRYHSGTYSLRGKTGNAVR